MKWNEMDNLQLKCGFDDDKNKTKLAHWTLGPGCLPLCLPLTFPFAFTMVLPSLVACLASLHMSLCYWWPQMLMSQSSLALLSYYATLYLSRSISLSLSPSLSASRQVSHWRPSLKQANLLHTSCQQPEPLCVCAACLWQVHVHIYMCVRVCITFNYMQFLASHCLPMQTSIEDSRLEREKERVLRNIFHIFHGISSDSHLSHFNSSFIYAKGKLSGDTLAPSATQQQQQ